MEERYSSKLREELSAMSKAVQAGVLEISYLESGDADGWPVVLSHGFPFDVRAYAEVASHLCSQSQEKSGPELLLAAVEKRCATWPPRSLHLERF